MDMEDASAGKRVRVAIVDDQLLLREGIATLLASDSRLEVVGRGANGQDAIDLAGSLRPDIILLDIRMPVIDGIQALREIKLRWPEVRAIVLTSFVNDGYVVEGLMAGADGYLLKDSSPSALISSIIAVSEGERVLEPGIVTYVAKVLAKQNQQRNSAYDGLTPRQLQMLTMIARGFVAKEIARELQVSEKTVRNHISHIYQKLGIFDRAQAILYAIRKGLVIAE
jgi:DNA-binding NarL/FixJ family response regulator